MASLTTRWLGTLPRRLGEGCWRHVNAAARVEKLEMRFLDILMDEHRGFSLMLDVLDAIAGRLSRGAAVPLPMLIDVLDFFENFTDRHHDKEEEMLFPLLAQHGIGPDQTVVSALMSQHEAGRMYGAKMRAELSRLQDGDPIAARALAEDARGYTELIREHIRIEDQYFYKLADEVLTHAEQAKIVAQFGGGVDARPASPDRERYLRMLDVYPGVASGWRS
jgi:hemerythrin-like domain-containing protein